MNVRLLALTAALSVVGPSCITTAASAAELAIPPIHRHHHYRAVEVHSYRTGYVFWDDVYPPAFPGPYLKPVEEVAALKANAAPVSVLWHGYWYYR